ncbi:MAG: hypothetical protein HYU66_18515 [Armatimonadetes bacterium]|nr:hypothetical protein [Armatimonadota bacterium]
MPVSETAAALRGVARHASIDALGQTHESLLAWHAERADEPMARLRAPGRRVWLPVARLEQWSAEGTLEAHLRPLGLRPGAPVVEVAEPGEVYLADSARRRSHGSWYTPFDLAGEVVRHTLDPLRDDCHLSICDPAAGGGIFLLAALVWAEESGLCRPETRVEWVEQHLFAVDCDPLAVEVTCRSLWLAVADPAWPPQALERNIRAGDALVGHATSAVGATLVVARLGPALDSGHADGRPQGPPLHEAHPGADGLDWPAEPFHWPEAFPEVFAAGGFAAVVGNPPFLGGSFVSGALGRAYRDHLVRRVAGRRGNADLCAYFLRRAAQLLRPGGRCGFVLTNTIAEGDTRRVGLEPLLAEGCHIARAERARPWPGDAALHVSLVWLERGPGNGAVLDGRPVARIGATLTEEEPAAPRPSRLRANRGVAFNGTKIYGQGFLLTPSEARAYLETDARHAEVVLPYFSGDDLYGQPVPQATRWVICFRDWPFERAAEYPELLERVRLRVKPERDRLLGRNTIGTRRAEAWWQFGTPAGALYEALHGRDTCIAKVLHSDTHAFVPVSAHAVFSHALAIFASDDSALLAVLQSIIHRAWAGAWGSSLGTAARYTLSSTFETFPLPALGPELREVGEEFERIRCRLMVECRLGLTALQRAAPPALVQAQAELDRTVAAAYGWEELPADAEVLRRLLELNRQRAEEEEALAAG